MSNSNKIVISLYAALIAVLLTGCNSTKIFVANFNEKSQSNMNTLYSPPETPNGDKITRTIGTLGTATYVDSANGGIVGTSLRNSTASGGGTNPEITFHSTSIGSPGKKYSIAWTGRKIGGGVALDCYFGTESSPGQGLRFFNGQAMIPGGSVIGPVPDGVNHRVFMSLNAQLKTYSVTITPDTVPPSSFSGSVGTSLLASPSKILAACSYKGFTAMAGQESYTWDKMEFRKTKQ